MRIWMLALGLVLTVGALAPAQAQTTGLATPNPQTPVFVVRPNPPGTMGSRETIPFSDEPHALNNPHPMLPNAGLGFAARQVWMPPQPVAMQVYVPTPEGIPARYQTMFAQVPGFYATETPTGVWLPERWVLDQVSVGLYQWRVAPMQFVPNGSR